MPKDEVQARPEHTGRPIRVSKSFDIIINTKDFKLERGMIKFVIVFYFYYKSCQVEKELKRDKNRLIVKDIITMIQHSGAIYKQLRVSHYEGNLQLLSSYP